MAQRWCTTISSPCAICLSTDSGGVGMVMVRVWVSKSSIRSIPVSGHSWVCCCIGSPQRMVPSWPWMMSGDASVPLSSGRKNSGSCIE